MNDGGVYLIHLERPYKHARHYIGFARNIEARLDHHRRGSGANFLKVVTRAGIPWHLVRVWAGQDKTFERRIKGRSATRLCPECNPESWMNYGHTDPTEGRREAGRKRAPLLKRDAQGHFIGGRT